MISSIKTRSGAIVLAALAAVCALAVMFAINSRSAVAEVKLEPMSLSGTQLESLDRSMNILTRPRTKADQNALASVPGVAIDANDDFKLDFATAVAGSESPLPALLAKTTDGSELCLIVAGGLNCVPPSVLKEKGAAPSIGSNPAGTSLSVIALDDVKSVQVVAADGSIQTVPIADNVSSTSLKEIPQEVRWTFEGKSNVIDLRRLEEPVSASK